MRKSTVKHGVKHHICIEREFELFLSQLLPPLPTIQSLPPPAIYYPFTPATPFPSKPTLPTKTQHYKKDTEKNVLLKN